MNKNKDRHKDLYLLMSEKVQKYSKYLSLPKTLTLINEMISLYDSEKTESPAD